MVKFQRKFILGTMKAANGLFITQCKTNQIIGQREERSDPRLNKHNTIMTRRTKNTISLQVFCLSTELCTLTGKV